MSWYTDVQGFSIHLDNSCVTSAMLAVVQVHTQMFPKQDKPPSTQFSTLTQPDF